MGYYQTHVFFCTHSREGDKPCCAARGSCELREYAKAQVKALNLSGKGGVRINASGCLGRCKEGPTVVVYPEGIWYTFHSKQDIDEIIHEHLIKRQVVTRLLMPNVDFERDLPNNP